MIDALRAARYSLGDGRPRAFAQGDVLRLLARGPLVGVRRREERRARQRRRVQHCCRRPHGAGPYNLSGSFKLAGCHRRLPVLRAPIWSTPTKRSTATSGPTSTTVYKTPYLELHLRPAAEPDADLHHARHHRARRQHDTLPARRRRRDAGPGPRQGLPERVHHGRANQQQQPPSIWTRRRTT